jgi:hypothetical protein
MMNAEHDALVERLQHAQEIVKESDLAAEFNPVAFAEVFRALDDGAATSDTKTRQPVQRRVTTMQGELSERLAAVAQAFDVDPSVIEQVFADDDDQLVIVLPPRRFESSSRGAMKQVAILMTCARQAGGWDGSWTQPKTIRDECMRIGVCSKNFGAVIEGLDMFSGQGTGSQRRLRAHNASFKAARNVLKELGVLDDDRSSDGEADT